MARFPPWHLAVVFCSISALIFHPVAARADQTIHIELHPRGYSDPRAAEDFICGLDTTVDPQNFLAELNADYIFDFLDNTGDNAQTSRTQVFDVVTFWRNGDIRIMADEFQHALSYDGLLLLFLLPPGRQCNSQTFEDARDTKEGYFPVFIGNSDDVWLGMEEFLDEADELKSYYDNQYPKLCGSISPMANETAMTRASTLQLMFNFKFNADISRKLSPSKMKTCELKNETLEAMKKADLFDFTPQMYFEDQNITASECEGHFNPVIKRTQGVSRKAVGFVTTQFQNDRELNWASIDDIVPYSGPVAFKPNEDSTTISIQIKEDDQVEEIEYLCVEIYDGNDTSLIRNRRKRSPGKGDGGGGGGQGSSSSSGGQPLPSSSGGQASSSSSDNQLFTGPISDSKPVPPTKPKYKYNPNASDEEKKEQQNELMKWKELDKEFKRVLTEARTKADAETKAKKINDIKQAAIKETGLKSKVLDDGTNILTANSVAHSDNDVFFTISFDDSNIIKNILDDIDSEGDYQIRRTNLIFLELGTPQKDLYNAGLLHLVFGKAGPDREEVQKGKKTMYKDKHGVDHGPGHGQEFEKFFEEVTDYKVGPARMSIANILERVITTWPAYGWTSDPTRKGMTLGFHGLSDKQGEENGKDIFVTVVIGDNGFVVTSIVSTEPDSKMKPFFGV